MKKVIFLCLALTAGMGLFSACEPDYVTDANNNGNNGNPNNSNGNFVVNVTSGTKSGTTFTSNSVGTGVATQGTQMGKTIYLFVINYGTWGLAGNIGDLDNHQFTFVDNDFMITDITNQIIYESIENQGNWTLSNIQVIRDMPEVQQKVIKCKITFKGKFNARKGLETIEENVELNGTLNF